MRVKIDKKRRKTGDAKANAEGDERDGEREDKRKERGWIDRVYVCARVCEGY